MASIIPLLTEFEKTQLSERQALPEQYLGLSDGEMDARIARHDERSPSACSFSATTISAMK